MPGPVGLVVVPEVPLPPPFFRVRYVRDGNPVS